MSKSSTFASFAAEAEKPKEIIINAKGSQLTVGELIAALLNQDPDLPVFHVEFGGITSSASITITEESVTIE